MRRSAKAVVIQNLDYSLISLRSYTQKALPAGLATVSSNGREFTSNRFVFRKNKYEMAQDATSRYYAKITILGSSQPYSVEVTVYQEKRIWNGERSSFKVVSESSYLARKVAADFNTELTKRREDPNIIDDFRVF